MSRELKHRNLRGEPFDFGRWRLWLDREAQKLRSRGYDTRFTFGDEFKPKTNLDADGETACGHFTNWETGETDFAVLSTQTKSPLVDRMGLILNDSNFEATFQEFLSYLNVQNAYKS